MLFVPHFLWAQLTIDFPKERMTYQRGQDNSATIRVIGNFTTEFDSVQARMVARVNGQGQTTAWKTIQYRSEKPYLLGELTCTAGWYDLQVNLYKNGNPIASTQVNRVGVGEVFVVAGQSNASGGAWTGIPSSYDRVNAVGFANDESDYNRLTIGFSKLDQDSSKIGPFQFVPWVWSQVGQALVDSLNLPVSFYGAAFGGTEIVWWYQAANNLPLTNNPSWVREQYGAPFRALEQSLAFYASLTGVRAVLWHQGESDKNTSLEDYSFRLNSVIAKTREIIESPTLAWMVARVSYSFGPSANPILGQNAVINADAHVFAGPETDNIYGTLYRSDNIHFDTPLGQIAFASSWMNYLNSSFFSNSIPVLSQPFVEPTFSCGEVGTSTPIQLSISGPYATMAWSNRDNTNQEALGYSHDCCNEYTNLPPSGYNRSNWKFDSTANLSLPAGKYSFVVERNSKKRLFSPILNLQNFSTISTPSISANHYQVRPGDQIALFASNCTANLKWSHGPTTSPINAVIPQTQDYFATCSNLYCSKISNTIQIVASSCFANSLNLAGSVNSSQPYFGSKEQISSTQKILSNGAIDYTAQKAIILNPGFIVETGGVFKASMEGCN